ncbi:MULTISPECIES: ABC transporter substrate-binding protein [Streptomyces]|uniref:Sugar ABC transporter substrate-binding protein n=1 Tax=Streptomyces koelreuteriae TaxID=2838015 RepID=A0ABX8G0Z3_9ACTN|nr:MULTISPECIES: sugar ABC transporter substrate-binding protein [Streptomyces]QWB27190.1 sugar ABC transporter substrate-binding protein [Streptomyces koelreuteriae]UUA10273.1 sugar ABC transporter substrate-binding protein [Streptomyces koelreuteriae]UUA17880.1 sugar ABC transporter substrate-binding protein [Streptomyces sp. CRCS-T-1]
MSLASVSAITASACSPSSGGSTGSAGDGKGTVEFWSMPYWIGQDDKVKELVDDFNASQSDVKVNLTQLEWKDGREKIKQAIAAGKGPDVWLMNNGLELDYLKARSLAPLDKLGYTAADTARFSDLVEVNEYENKLYGAPLYFDAGVMLYRTDVLRKYGYEKPPATWEELKRTASAITEKSAADGGKISGWQFKGMDDHVNAINSTWESFLCQAGGSLTSPDHKKSTQHTEAGKTTMNYMRSFYQDKTSPVGTSALNGFIDGKVAMFSFFQSVIANVEAGGDKTEGKWAVAPMPKGPESGCSMVGGHSLVANAQGQDLKAAGTFMKWLASPERSVRYMDFHAIFPYDPAKIDPSVKATYDKKIAGDPSWKPILEQASRNSPDLVLQDRHGWATRWEAQKSAIVAGVNGQLPVDEALKSVDGEVGKALDAEQ